MKKSKVNSILKGEQRKYNKGLIFQNPHLPALTLLPYNQGRSLTMGRGARAPQFWAKIIVKVGLGPSTFSDNKGPK